jgi:hypothetical protein
MKTAEYVPMRRYLFALIQAFYPSEFNEQRGTYQKNKQLLFIHLPDETGNLYGDSQSFYLFDTFSFFNYSII